MRNKPYHTLLLPLFFVLHVVNSYYGLIFYKIIFGFLTIYLVAALLLLLTGQLLFRNVQKAGCWATSILIIFFFFGSANDFLNRFPLPALLLSYKFLLPLTGLIVFLISYALKRFRQPAIKATTYLNMAFLLFVGFELSSLVYKIAAHEYQKTNLSYFNKPVLDSFKISNSQKPDIFFIVFDEYSSSAALKKYFHYDNHKLDSSLTRNNFFIVPNSKSNYNATPFSIASTFNLDYFNKPLQFEKTEAKLRLQAVDALSESQLPKFLRKHGYRILNFGVFSLKGYPVRFDEFSLGDQTNAFYGETLWGRIKKDVWWNAYRLFGSQYQLKFDTELLEENANNFHLTLKELGTQTNMPKFVFSHVMIPHRPFVIDSTGKRVPFHFQEPSTGKEDSLYLSQLVYINKWIDSLANASNKKFTRSRVIIIEGDHGYRDSTLSKNGNHDYYFMNLNSYFFSDKDYHGLYDSISPVNSFRIVLNKYFGTQMPLLKDSTILLN